ncbi:hypothetical protein JMJ77_0000772, partial [Colletotrichum scovillei]
RLSSKCSECSLHAASRASLVIVEYRRHNRPPSLLALPLNGLLHLAAQATQTQRLRLNRNLSHQKLANADETTAEAER